MLGFFTKFYQSRLKKNSFFKNASWSLFGSLILRGSGIIAGIYVAKIIGSESFGAYGMFKNFVLSLSILSTFGLGYTSTKFIAENKDDEATSLLIIKNSMFITCLVSILISLVLFIFSEYVATYLFKDVNLNLSVKIISVWLLFNAITTVQQAILSGFSKFDYIAKINVVVGLLTFVLSILLSYYFHFIGALYALLICQVINCLLNYIYLKKVVNNFPNNNESVANLDINLISLLKASLPITLTELNFSFFVWLNSYLIIYFFNYKELGIFNVAMQWYMIILFIPGVLRSVLLSTISSNTIDNKKKIVKQMLLLTFLSTAIPSLLIFFGSGIIVNFYGTEYYLAKNVISILCLAAILVSLSNVFVQFFISNNNFWLVFILRSVYDIITAYSFYYVSTHWDFKNGSFVMSLILTVASSLYLFFNYVFYNTIVKR